MKILLLNNYDLICILEEFREDGQAAHQLWGSTQMQNYSIKTQILPYKKYNLLKNFSNRLKILGDLDQQLRVLTSINEFDLIYSGHLFTTSLLALLRKFKLLKKPIITIAFQVPKPSFFGQLFVKFFVTGNDRIICLSQGIKQHFEEDFGLPQEKLEVIEWGYDVEFHQSKPLEVFQVRKEGYILSTGKSFRDYKTLIQAFQEIDFSLDIVGYDDNILDQLESLPQNIKITIPTNIVSTGTNNFRPSNLPQNVQLVEQMLKTSQILQKYGKAYAVAIPLDLPPNKPYNTVGLSCLVEAMCMGRAIITTENKDMGVNLEKEGIGITVPLKDSQAWKQAIQYLLDHPQETLEMGQKARYLAEQKYNLENFTRKIAHCMHSLVPNPSLNKN